LGARIPASIAVMGAALKNPYLGEDGQASLLDELRNTADWDLDDPERFYKMDK